MEFQKNCYYLYERRESKPWIKVMYLGIRMNKKKTKKKHLFIESETGNYFTISYDSVRPKNFIKHNNE